MHEEKSELNPDPPTPPGVPELPSLDGRVPSITAEYTQSHRTAEYDDGISAVPEPPD